MTQPKTPLELPKTSRIPPQKTRLSSNNEKLPILKEYRNEWRMPHDTNRCECRPYVVPNAPFDALETCPGFQRSKERYAEYLKKNKTQGKNLARTTMIKGKDVMKMKKRGGKEKKRNGMKKEINRNNPKVQKFSSQSEKMGGNKKKKRKKKEEMKE